MSIIGSLRLNSQGIISTKARAQIAANVTIKPEPNQSSSRPRSSTTSRAPRNVATKQKADHVEPRLLLRIGFVRGQKGGDQRDRGEADRAVDQEAPAPGVSCRRASRRASARPRARQPPRRQTMRRLGRVSAGERRRPEWIATPAPCRRRPVPQDAEHKERVQIPGLRAQNRAHAEKPEADQEEGLAAKHTG